MGTTRTPSRAPTPVTFFTWTAPSPAPPSSTSNAGNLLATGVVITDIVPVSVTRGSLSFDSSGAQITATGNISYVWQVADLGTGEWGIIIITGVLSDSLAAGAFDNTATITTTLVDGNPSNNSDTIAFTVEPPLAVDMVIHKAVTPAQAAPGDPITYTLTYSNAGDVLATGVVITDIVPVSVKRDGLSVSSSGATITGTVNEVDDFESGLPSGSDSDGIAIGFVTWHGPTSTVAITTTSTASAGIAPVPGKDGSNQVIALEMNVETWGGFTHRFENEAANEWVSQDWSDHKGFSFWYYGTGSGTTIFMDILENRNPGSTDADAERWTVEWPDNKDGWQFIQFSFSDLERKDVNGTPDDGWTGREVHGWSLATRSTGGPETRYVDDFGLQSTYVWQVADLASGEGGIITIAGVLSDSLAAGAFDNTATIATALVDGDPSNNSDTASVTVEGVAVYGSTPAPGSAINVGTVSVDSAISTTLTISEMGGATLAVTPTLSGADAGDFEVAPTTLTILDDGAAQDLTISCTPSVIGTLAATLTVAHNAPNSPAVYPLNCTGIAVFEVDTSGGTQTFTDTMGSKTTIDIPAGALSETTTFTYTPKITPTHPALSGFGFVGRNFELNASSQISGQITITLEYSDDDWRDAGINDENFLRLHYWNEESSAWDDVANACGPPVPTYGPDTENNILAAPVCHLSEFAMVGQKAGHSIYLPLVLRNQ
ncbi:MAG: DUF11 domain-containing protein [Chloroflexi bacterium]|nr:DUF11 domain-containing protein [Chloroflexota bacterium]